MGEVRGSIDGFEGLYLTGWAVDGAKVGPCLIEVRDAGGRVVASGAATRARPDLAVLGYGRTDFAFRVPVDGIVEDGLFAVTADGVALPGSPVRAGPGNFDGFFEVANGHLDGWVTERAAGQAAPEISVVDGRGVVLARAVAVAAVDAPDGAFAPARFYIPLPEACIGRPAVAVHLRANGVRFGPERAVSLAVRGGITLLLPERCAGWVGADAAPARRFVVDVLRDGVVVASVRADQPVVLAGVVPEGAAAGGAWEVGFDLALPAPADETAVHSVSVRFKGGTTDLFGGPFLVGPRGGFIGLARRAARVVHEGLPGLGAAERALVQQALAEYARFHRFGPMQQVVPAPVADGDATLRLIVLIPVYRDVEVTRTCIESVLAQRDAARDALVLVNDASPEPGMAGLLDGFAALPNVTVLHNPANIGFVRSVNRGLDNCLGGDVLLLNSDTRLFAGALDEMHAVAHGGPDIGTVTAMSNNATIFSFPEVETPAERLEDVSWEELAGVALAANRGVAIEVPTAHGFCMLIRRDALVRVGRLNEVFGRGYAEENEFCQRAADLGFRHVAAAGVLVEHRERISFGAERDGLLATNLARLSAMFPEYNDNIRNFLADDPLGVARWPLHAHRVRKARAAYPSAVLVVGNQLGGGTRRAEEEIGRHIGYRGAMVLRLSCTQEGGLELAAGGVVVSSVADDAAGIFVLLESLGIELVLIHHVLGFDAGFVRGLAGFAGRHRTIAWAHDFLAVCPRVTMIDALDGFCGGAPVERCARCVALGGGHEASRMEDLSVAEHRAVMRALLAAAEVVVAPSRDTADRVAALLPGIVPVVVPHAHFGGAFPAAVRAGSAVDIALLGAIGPHKGSAELLRLARRAMLTHPGLRFHVIGYTDCDAALLEIGNVTVSGKYAEDALPGLIAASGARVALFLHVWPETFSYTLSEAVAHGLFPVVPDLGAPAERVRAAGFGAVFPFPIDPAVVLDVLADPALVRGSPAGFADPDAAGRIAALLRAEAPAAPKPVRRGKAKAG